jgi:hypothetical protein
MTTALLLVALLATPPPPKLWCSGEPGISSLACYRTHHTDDQSLPTDLPSTHSPVPEVRGENEARPPDSLLVDVQLAYTAEHVLVDAVLFADSTLLLPAAPIYQLLGLGQPAAQWVTPQAIHAAYPTVTVVWEPRNLLVVVLDPLQVLPASKRVAASQLAQTRYAFSLPVHSGPYASVAWDEHGRSALLETGYNWRGRVAVAARGDYGGAAAWTASLAPSSHVYLTYSDGLRQRPTGTARVALGPLWLSGSYVSPRTPVDLSGLFHVGPLQLFASSQFGVVTLTPVTGMVVQASRIWQTKSSAFRISVGPAPLSPFTVPASSLTGR